MGRWMAQVWVARLLGYAGVGAATVAVGLAMAGCGGGATAPAGGGGATSTASAPVVAAGIHPLTQVSGTAGYFVDPLPIQRNAAAGSYIPSISGTTQQVLECTSLAVGCYTANTLTIVSGPSIKSQLPAGVTLAYQNNNIYQDSGGNWQMATTANVNNVAANPTGKPWTVILHAVPAVGSATTASGVPLAWTSDTLLVGSFTVQAAANYDGKYFADSTGLYLIYSMQIQSTPTSQDGIVAQLMDSATQVDGAKPVPLLVPENNADGGYNSELFDCQTPGDNFKLIETGNISIVSGKYAMAYSTGSYETPCYKVGIAWADSLKGPYKKILQADPSDIWGNPTVEPEVLYLIQAIEPGWPNYVNSTVQGPGVPSLVQYPAGTWYLYFAGYDPSVMASGGMFSGKLRQPYFMRLSVNVPSGTTVAATANTALAGWITAATQ